MDAVRFGRALGFGARQAVKTVASAVDAATAESPAASPTTSRSAGPSAAPVAGASVAQAASLEAVQPQTGHASVAGTTARSASADTTRPLASFGSSSSGAGRPVVNKAAKAVAQGVTQARGVRRGFSRFRASAMEPVVRLSGVLWLEVTGVFFAIFALFAATWVWRLRGEWREGVAHPGAHGAFVGGVAMFVLFGYFCVSSFVRAKRREQRRG